jgi:23S rRNA pseudouridine1911/1915/1917 synthase
LVARPPVPRTLHVDPKAQGQRVDIFLAAAIDRVSRSQLTRHIIEGAVSINGVRAVPSRKVKAGDVVVWQPPPPRPSSSLPEVIPLVVVHEDAHLIVIDKPPGMVVHPAPAHPTGTLVNALLAHCRDLRGVGDALRPGIVHRLDKDTSGLLVVAKDDVTMNALGADFAAHRIRRIYEALVVGLPRQTPGRVETLHGRDRRDRKKFSVQVQQGRRAITDWRLLESLHGRATRIEAELHTGRTHQVRVHCVALGCPVLGDTTYGRAPRDLAVRQIARTIGRQALHARVLGFHHPATGTWMEFSSSPPEDFQQALGALRALGPVPRSGAK